MNYVASLRSVSAWKIDVSTATLMTCIGRKISFHRRRINFWKEEYKNTSTALGEIGPVEDYYGKSDPGLTSNMEKTAQANNLKSHLQTAGQKIKYHEQELREAEKYDRFLTNTGDGSLPCTVDDIEYFRVFHNDTDKM